MTKLAVIVIGRNEGVRLRRCLESALTKTALVIYVDSASTDRSVLLAQQLGVSVVELDMSIPFSAARARNAGFTELKKIASDIELVQFVDGDCEIIEGWFTKAIEFLDKNPAFALVCGRRRERFPEKSVFNRMCDIEWNTRIGEADACGGDFMVRASNFAKINGFNANLIAGEEPEMCFRLRESGAKIYRVDADMTWHDADITYFKQWWLRAKRAGHAYANVAHMEWRLANGIWKREVVRIWIWGLVLPVMLLLSTSFFSHYFIVGTLIYPVQVARIATQHKNAGLTPILAWSYAFFCVLAKFPEMLGQLTYWKKMLKKEPHTLIEYKF